MKTVIFVVVGLLVGLGGGTAYKALQVKGESQQAMQARADSLVAAEAAAAEDGHGGEDGAPEEQRPDEQLVLHRAAVDEQELRHRRTKHHVALRKPVAQPAGEGRKQHERQRDHHPRRHVRPRYLQQRILGIHGSLRSHR